MPAQLRGVRKGDYGASVTDENVAKSLSPVKYSREPIAAPPSNERSALRQSDYDFVPRGWIETYVRWACSRVPAPPIFHVACALSYAAFQLARHGWAVEGALPRPALWWALLAKSSTGKGLALKCIRALDSALTTYAAGDGGTSLLDDVLKDDDEPSGYAPGVLDLTGTPEGIFWALESRQYLDPFNRKRSVLFGVHDEMQEIVGRCNKHDSYENDLHACFDQSNDGLKRQQLNLKRKQDKINGKVRTGVIPYPTLSVVFTSTEDRLIGALVPRQLYGGLCSRFIWLTEPRDWADPSIKDDSWLDPYEALTPTRTVVTELARWVGAIADLSTRKIIRFSSEGAYAQKRARMRWRDDYSTQVKEVTNRYATHLLNLSVVIAAVEAPIEADTGALEVASAHVELAERLCLQGIPAARSLAGISDITTRTLQLVERRPGISRTDVCSALNLDPHTMRETLTMLVEDEELIAVQVFSGKRGRPRWAYFMASLRRELGLVDVERVSEPRLRELQAQLRGDRMSVPPPNTDDDDTDDDSGGNSGGNAPPSVLN